jgi:hypothetical protein
VLLEPRDRLGVEVVRRLVEKEEVGRLEEQPAEGDAPALAARDLRHVGVGRRAAERVHRDLERRSSSQASAASIRVLHRPARRGGLSISSSELPSPIFTLSSSKRAGDRGSRRLPPRRSEHVFFGIERRLLGEPADTRPLGRPRLAEVLLVDAGHDAKEGRLPRPVRPRTPIFAPGKNDEPDPLQDLAAGRDDLPETLHRRKCTAAPWLRPLLLPEVTGRLPARPKEPCR